MGATTGNGARQRWSILLVKEIVDRQMTSKLARQTIFEAIDLRRCLGLRQAPLRTFRLSGTGWPSAALVG